MADALIGFGIGLSGTPKDYTSIVAARQRQNALTEQKKREEKDKEFEPLRKSIFGGDKVVMPYQVEENQRDLQQTILDLAAAKESGDYRAAAEAQQGYLQRLGQRAEERKLFDEGQKQFRSGKSLTDLSQFYTFKTRQEALDYAAQNADEFYIDDQNKVIGYNAIPKMNMHGEFLKLSNTLTGTPTGKTETLYYTNANGETVPYTKEIIEYPPGALENRIAATFDSDAIFRKNAIFNYKASAGDEVGKLSNEAINKNAKEWAIKTGLEFLRPNYAKGLPLGGKGLNVNVNMGGGQQSLTEPYVPSSGDKPKLKDSNGDFAINSYMTVQPGDVNATIPYTDATFNMYSNKKSSRVGAAMNKVNRMDVVYVVDKNFTIPKLGSGLAFGGFNTEFADMPSSIRTNSGGDYYAGQIVRPELEAYLLRKGLMRATIVAFGTAGDESVYREAPGNYMNLYIKSSKDDEKKITLLKQKQDEMQQQMQKIADDYARSQSTKTKAPAVTTSKTSTTTVTTPKAPAAPSSGSNAKKIDDWAKREGVQVNKVKKQ